VGLPWLLLVVALTTWKAVGLALAPVEGIRVEVDEISTLRINTGEVSAARVHRDPSGLRRVLRSLGDNAAQHASTRVKFALDERIDGAVLAVDDDRPGIPEVDRARVLERLVRLDDARAHDDGGSGLGLAIVAELVGAHGGTLAVTTSPLGGARIEVTLPRS
jgi:signal transduction histidine kinase